MMTRCCSHKYLAELFNDIDDTFLVALSLILNIFYNSFYTIVQQPTLSDHEIIAKFYSTKHLTSIIRTF